MAHRSKEISKTGRLRLDRLLWGRLLRSALGLACRLNLGFRMLLLRLLLGVSRYFIALNCLQYFIPSRWLAIKLMHSYW